MIRDRNTSHTPTLHIFGGGDFVSLADKIAHGVNWDVVVRTGKRFSASLPPLNSNTRILVGDDLKALMHEGGMPQAGDFGVSFSAPWIFSQEVIDLFGGGLFNLHNQPLPKYKGGGGASWLILMRERRGGCCIHQLVRKIDAGDIYARVDFEYPQDCRFPMDFDGYAIERAKELVTKWLSTLLETRNPGSVIAIDELEGEYWPRLNTDIHGWIDWSWGLKDIEVFCDAFSYPHQGAITMIRDGSMRLKKVKAVIEKGKFHPFQRGLVYRIHEGLAIAHPDGTLLVEEYAFDNQETKVVLGDRLYSMSDKLQAAVSRRVQYLPSGVLIDK